MKKALNLFLIAGLALAGVPAGAQDYAPNTVWGEVPQSVASNASTAVLQDTSGRVAATVPVIAGKFAFPDVSPGQYVVALQTGLGPEVARSCPVGITSGSAQEAVFTCDRVPAAVVPSGAVPPTAGGGLSKTAWILIGAAAVGITAAIVILTDDDEGTASPSR